MSESKHFVYLLRIAPRSDLAVLLICFGPTIVFDMVVSVTGGGACAWGRIDATRHPPVNYHALTGYPSVE